MDLVHCLRNAFALRQHPQWFEFACELCRTSSFSRGWDESHVAVDSGLPQGHSFCCLKKVTVWSDHSNHFSSFQIGFPPLQYVWTDRFQCNLVKRITKQGQVQNWTSVYWAEVVLYSSWSPARSTAMTGTLGICPACETNSGQSSSRRWKECVIKKQLWSNNLLWAMLANDCKCNVLVGLHHPWPPMPTSCVCYLVSLYISYVWVSIAIIAWLTILTKVWCGNKTLASDTRW